MSNIVTKAEALRALPLSKGLQFLVNEGYRIIGNPILIHDMDYQVITHTQGITTDDPIWNEFATTGTVNHERKVFYRDEEFFDAAANAKRITYLHSDKLKYNRIIGKLFSGDGIQIGVAIIVEMEPFDGDVPELFTLFCDIVDESIADSAYYSHYGQAYQEALIKELIEGIEDRGIYMAHVESIYMNLKDNLYLAVADITRCPLKNVAPTQIRDLFKRAQPQFKYAVYGGYIVMIISTDNPTFDIKRDMCALTELIEANNIHVGISTSFENLYELNQYYTEAVRALTQAR